jgi:hypothetical protein
VASGEEEELAGVLGVDKEESAGTLEVRGVSAADG